MTNNYVKRLILPCLALLLHQCQKEKYTLPSGVKGPQEYGWVKGLRNGEPWEGSAAWAYTIRDSNKIALSIASVHPTYQDIPMDELFINNIPLKKGEYTIIDMQYDNVDEEVQAFYSVMEVDVPLAQWDIKDSPESKILISHIDTATKTVRGRFYLHLKNSKYKEWPSSVKFTEMEFEIKKFE